jgi:Zn-dependent protease
MSWNPEEDFSEYNHRRAHQIDYSNPTFYETKMDQVSDPELSEQVVDPATVYTEYAHELPSDKVDYQTETVTPYRSPADIESFTNDGAAGQPRESKRGTSEGSNRRKGLAGLGGIGAAISALLLKFPLLAPLLKFGWLGFTALFSVIVYSLIFGWQFAIGLVMLLFVHEMGHAVVMKLKGIPIGGMIFIPLLGAAVIMKQMPRNAKDEAEVGIAGPIAGALASMVCLAIAREAPDTVWAPLAYFGFFINLFNLIPIVPFDGGRVLGAIDRRIWIIGFIGLVVFQVWQWINGNHSLFLLLFVILAATQLWSRRSAPNTTEGRAYYDVPITERIILGLAYFGLAAVLVLGMAISHGLMSSLGQ